MTLDAWIVRSGDYVCGFAAEVYEMPGGKAPYSRFAGHRERDGFHVQYTDSFTGPELNDATIRMMDGQLRIASEGKPTPYLDLDIGDLSRVNVIPAKRRRIDDIAGGTYDSCMRNRMNPAEYLREGAD